MRRLISLASALVVFMTSCAALVETGGDYALSSSDVEQIRRLAAERPDIKKPVFRIWAERPNRARVNSGRWDYAGDVFDEFTVVKRHGCWQIDSKIQEERIIVTGS
jgi:hypothetical protein